MTFLAYTHTGINKSTDCMPSVLTVATLQGTFF